MESKAQEMTIEQEQAAFDAQLAGLLKAHKGQFVLFKDGNPLDFFAAFEEAYAAGINRFGPDRVFLVMEVAEIRPQPVSLSWHAGVILGPT